MRTALFYETREEKKVQCFLCPHFCTLAEGNAGKCGVRRNVNGVLITETYRKVSAINFDPIEKKPLYHFYPGSTILSIGSIGCNLDCLFCQNCDISKAEVSGFPWYKDYPAEDIISMAMNYPGNTGIAFTYNEPVISYEYILEISDMAASAELKTAMISNGYINPDPLLKLIPFMDAFNIDLKAFSEDFYAKQTKSHLKPVKETLKILKKAGKHLEITNLIIPGLNDDPGKFAEMVDWIASDLGKDSVLHLSRYFPQHKMSREATPVKTLLDLYTIAKKKLHYVYIGNAAIEGKQHTYCPECGKVLVYRDGYRTEIIGLSGKPVCDHCHAEIKNFRI